jgi:hypothetical protein
MTPGDVVTGNRRRMSKKRCNATFGHSARARGFGQTIGVEHEHIARQQTRCVHRVFHPPWKTERRSGTFQLRDVSVGAPDERPRMTGG